MLSMQSKPHEFQAQLSLEFRTNNIMPPDFWMWVTHPFSGGPKSSVRVMHLAPAGQILRHGKPSPETDGVRSEKSVDLPMRTRVRCTFTYGRTPQLASTGRVTRKFVRGHRDGSAQGFTTPPWPIRQLKGSKELSSCRQQLRPHCVTSLQPSSPHCLAAFGIPSYCEPAHRVRGQCTRCGPWDASQSTRSDALFWSLR
ncbi:MAG: hypothetical protein JWM16_1543 [Verrucomicrobiales bacterium]|nr:hypothetical protein [Verrucomicrobiales bacterium]